MDKTMKISCPRVSAHARLGLIKFLSGCKDQNLTTVLDIGAGKEEYHANDMRNSGLNVDTVDFFTTNTFRGDYISLPTFDKQYDAIWCAHTLEHQPNVGLFLKRIFNDVKETGLVCITVPPAKDNIVGGHLTLWNAGLLLYNLILAGFDCSNAAINTYDYNITILLYKRTANLPILKYDTGDIELLEKFFPRGLNIKQGFDGNIIKHNW